jgi:Tfp pilus assembly protein PilF
MRKLTSIIVLVFACVAAFAQTLQDAQKAIDNENYFKAKQILNKLLLDGSANAADVKYYLGNAYLKDDDRDSAKLYYKQVYNPEVRSALGYLANGRLALLAKNTAEAKQNFDRAVQTTKSKNANIFYEIGDAYLRPEVTDVNAAITNLESAFAIDNKNLSIVLALADAYDANSGSDNTMGGKAMNKYEYATDLDKSSSFAWIKMGRLWTRGQKYDLAIENFNKGIALEPNNAILYKELGEAYYLSKQYDKTLTNFQKYIDLSPGDSRARTALLEMYFRNKNYEKSAEEATKGLAKEPGNWEFSRFLFYSNFELKRYKDGYEVMKNYWQTAGVRPKSKDYVYSARLASQMGDTTAALSYFNTALANDSSNCELLGEYGKVLFQSKRYSDAISQYLFKKEKCGKLTYLELFYLGRSYYITNDSILADSTFSEYVSRFPTTTDGYFWKAQVLLKFKLSTDEFAAYPFYQEFIKLAEKNPGPNKSKLIEAYNYSGLFKLEREKDNAAAKAYFNKSLELDPNDAIALEILKSL